MNYYGFNFQKKTAQLSKLGSLVRIKLGVDMSKTVV